jgi:plasmid rolling circle replication initiator protein Rep
MSQFYLSDLSDKDKPWDKRRSETDVVSSLYKQVGCERLVERLDSCSQLLLFAIAQDGIFALESARFCRVRTCPTCQWRKQLMWKGRFHVALPDIERDYPSHRWILLTFTVKNCPITELRETVSWMNQSWQRLIQRKIFPADGFVRSTEVTRNEKDGTAHPHFHVLLFVKAGYFKGKGYIKKDEWSTIWQQCLRVYYRPVVDVRVVKDLGGSVKEVLKYSVKPSDLVADAEWLKELTIQLHKTRAVSVGGVLKSYFSEEEPTDEDLIHGEESTVEVDENNPRFIAHWQKPEKRYKGNLRE